MTKRTFDLDDRLIEYAAAVSIECDRLPRTFTGRHVAGQLVRSATAPLANYGEARAAESRRDFIHKLKLCLKELRESLAWLRFIRRAGLREGDQLAVLLKETNELIAIFVTNIRTAQRNPDP